MKCNYPLLIHFPIEGHTVEKDEDAFAGSTVGVVSCMITVDDDGQCVGDPYLLELISVEIHTKSVVALNDTTWGNDGAMLVCP